MPRIPGLQVVQSKVQGYGLITTKPRRIADVEGILWRQEERRDDTHSLYLEPGIFFDMVDQTRWLNHSCDPNVLIEAGITDDGEGWAQVQALKNIKAGEELFFHYAFDPSIKEPCRCGTPACNGWIVDGTEITS
jgi:hypothetical protein